MICSISCVSINDNIFSFFLRFDVYEKIEVSFVILPECNNVLLWYKGHHLYILYIIYILIEYLNKL